MKGKLSQRMKLILALLKVYGKQPVENLMQIVYPGQTEFLSRQRLYLIHTLRHLEEEGLIEKDATGTLWRATKKE